MNRRIALAMMALACAGCGGAPAPTPPTAPTPPPAAPEARVAPPFSPPEGGFRLALPGTPKRTEESVDLPTGGKLRATTFASSEPGTRAILMLSIIDYPREALSLIENKDLALDNAAIGLVMPYRGQITHKEAITLDGSPGREFTFDIPPGAGQGPRLGSARIYLVGNRLYQVYVLGPSDAFPSERANAYLKSFELAGGT